MKRALKIIGITLGSLIGLIFLIQCLICYVILTPSRITPIVRQVAQQYVTCDHQIGEVDLTLFSSFPRIALRIDSVQLVHPMEGAISDTVLRADRLIAKANLISFVAQRHLVVDQLTMEGLDANIFINEQGETNLAVFRSSPDTTQSSSDFVMPFDSLKVTGFAIDAKRLTFIDKKDTIKALLYQTAIELEASNWDDMHLRFVTHDASCKVKDEPYAQHIALVLNLPASVNLNTMHFALRKASIAVNDLELSVDGAIAISDTIALDASVAFAKWDIDTVRALLPPSIERLLSDVQAHGQISVEARAAGLITNSLLPVIDATVVLDNGVAHYASVPYTFRDVALDADAHIDLNDKAQSSATVRKLYASTQESSVTFSGKLLNLLTDLHARAQVYMKVSLPDFASYLPETMRLQGAVQGGLQLDARLSDFTTQHFSNIQANGHLHLTDIDWSQDSLTAQLPKSELVITIPNAHPSRNKNNWLNLQLDVDALHAAQTGQWDAAMGCTKFRVETANIMAKWPIVSADVTVQSQDACSFIADSISAKMYAPNISGFAEVNVQDSTEIPTFDGKIEFKDLQARYSSYSGHLARSMVHAQMTHARHNKTAPIFRAEVSSAAVEAAMGNDTKITTRNIEMNAKAMYFPRGDKFLLKWNPVLTFVLNSAEADIAGFKQHVSVPQIMFTYNNREFDIINSRIVIGQSDFALKGKIENISNYLLEKGALQGDLSFTSDHTNVDELLSLFSADSGSEEKPREDTVNSTSVNRTSSDSVQADPFLVPQNVDLMLTTDIREATAFNTVAHNLGGKLYIKDGMLVLEEMGFVCDAAKLQLTAMYRTPRRNHLYLGLDYHMMDVKIDQLIAMIPQVDSMVPMLRSFKGEAEFHLAAETYMKEDYSIKPSTIRGACSIFGKDLVLMDSETFTKISKILMFNKKTENKVDSISAEMTIYKNEINVYPFCISLGNYMAALGGRHNLNMTFDYHINLLSPLYIGVDVTGSPSDLNIKPAKCIYAQDFRPIVKGKVDTQNAELRQLIRSSLKKNVKTE